MRKINMMIAVVILTGFLAGCGSASKITRDLLISSEPAGATVYMDGDKIGETPLKLQTFFTWNKDKPYDSLLRRVVQVRKDGYAPQTRDLYPIDMPNIVFFLSPESVPGEAKGGVK
jgi:hypothetical protein